MEYKNGKLDMTQRESNLAEMYLGNNVDWLDGCYGMFNDPTWMDRIESYMTDMGASKEDIEKDADGLLDLISKGHEAYLARKRGE